MNYVKAKLNWEEVFIQEAIDLEEKMSSLDLSALNKSRLRISLEKDILSWKKYQLWISAELNCATLNPDSDPTRLNGLVARSTVAFETFSHHDFWNEDLIPIDTWDENLIVIGLEKSEKLIEIPKAIFILAPPQILDIFANKLFNKSEGESSENSAEESFDENSQAQSDSMLDGINFNVAAPKIDFHGASISAGLNPPASASVPAPVPAPEVASMMLGTDGDKTRVPASTTSMWDYISERHEEYCFEAKKQFDAYIVLKIVSNRTQVFKMDSDLQKQNFNLQLFDYSLNDENPFKKVLAGGVSESFNINQLGFSFLDFKYACITPLKRSQETVGFLVGLKSKNLAETDQNLLEDLAKESA